MISKFGKQRDSLVSTVELLYRSLLFRCNTLSAVDIPIPFGNKFRQNKILLITSFRKQGDPKQ